MPPLMLRCAVCCWCLCWWRVCALLPQMHWDGEPIEDGLGKKYDSYTWRQTTKEIEIRIKLPVLAEKKNRTSGQLV